MNFKKVSVWVNTSSKPTLSFETKDLIGVTEGTTSEQEGHNLNIRVKTGRML